MSLTANIRVPLRFRRSEGYYAQHSHGCFCWRDCPPGERYQKQHLWRVFDASGRLLFQKRDAWVIRHATELWSEDDPFMEAEPLAPLAQMRPKPL